MKKSDLLLGVSLILLAGYLALSILVDGVASIAAITYDFSLNLSLLLGYPGAFVVSLIGNATILVPFPYVAVAFILGGLTDEITSEFVFNPVAVGILSGIGATIGEMTGYVVGYAGGRLIDEEQRSSFSRYVEKHPRATPLVLWFLAATPIPDDVLIVPLAASRYPWWKVLVPQLVGKTMFLSAIALSGRFGLALVESLVLSASSGGIVSRLIEVSAILLVVLSVYALVRVDWARLSRQET